MRDMNDSLDRLFRRYRELTPDPEASADFMPKLWQKIDARRSFAWKLRSYARALVTVSLTACLAMVAFQWFPSHPQPPVTRYYVEALDDENGPEVMASADLVNASFQEEGALQ